MPAHEKQNPHTVGDFTSPGRATGRSRQVSLVCTISLSNRVTASLITRNVRGERGRDTRIGTAEFSIPAGAQDNPVRILQGALSVLLARLAEEAADSIQR
jgi:hypothetical protein